MQVIDEQHTLAPAEQYLRALWRARWTYLLIVALFLGGALVLNVVLPKTYRSTTIVSVKQGPNLDSAGLLFDSVMAGSSSVDAQRGERQEIVPRHFLNRFQANRTVTLAARDAGIIAPTSGLDDRQINQWVQIEPIEKTDLLGITVEQPTPQGARNFAQKLLDRTIEASRDENNAAYTRQLLSDEVTRARAALDAASTAAIEAGAGAPGAAAAQRMRADRALLELDIARKTYAPLRRRLDVLNVLLAEQQLQLTVVDPPTLPLRPSYPRPLLNIAVALILGVLIATVVVVVQTVFAGFGPRLR
jgi:uncharacterized protein involved in exopolysaccharide biosynthesis